MFLSKFLVNFVSMHRKKEDFKSLEVRGKLIALNKEKKSVRKVKEFHNHNAMSKELQLRRIQITTIAS